MTLKEQLALKPTITITMERTEGLKDGASLRLGCGIFSVSRGFVEERYQGMDNEAILVEINRLLKDLVEMVATAE